MAVFRIEKTRDYTVMSNHHLRNTELSLKAKGLLSLMLSLPEGWDYTMKGLAHICKDGVDSISAGVRELEAHGYLIRERVRNANGQLGSIEYTILEQPRPPQPKQPEPIQENPIQVDPTLEAPIQGNPAQLNKDISSNFDKLTIAMLNEFIEKILTPTETPTEEATEIATETACPTCGTVGCTSEHLNWCSDCQKDDCGQNHCDTCGAIDCTTEHKICDKCGTLDCTADHTNWCAECKVDNCGQNHCPTCRAIDCTKEHKACETCSVIDCTADHTNWCNICKVDNCGKTHVYCETCQKYDCGENHNATEPTEPATEPVAPIDEGDVEETDPMVGKIVTLVESPGLLQAIENPTVSTAGSIVGVNAYPKYMEIEAVVTVGSATYYQLKAADTPDNDWPDYYGTSYEHYWLPSTQVTETELPKPCPVCNEYGCTTEHKQCEICGEYDCKAVHFWCDLCEEYDCGKSHLICPACGEVDCTKTHTWCGHCGGYDCGIEHVDEYKPDTTPVIPENPTMTPNAEVSIVDEYGDAVTEDGLFLIEGMKTSISAWPAADADSYQWQVRYNNANDLWVDIAGATGKGILVSPAMFLNIIDYQGSTAIRCVATSGDEVQISDAIPVIVEEAVPQQEMMMFAARPGTTGSGDAVVTAEGDGAAQYSIIIEFKFQNGDTAAQAWTASLSAGQDYVLDVECPAVVGYKPDRERITETITAISGNMTYTVTYTPDYVDYKVVHHQQNIGDNNYTAVKTETAVRRWRPAA